MKTISIKIHYLLYYEKCCKDIAKHIKYGGYSSLKLLQYILLCLVLLLIWPLESFSNPLVAVQGKIISVKQISNSCDIEIIVEMSGQYTYPNLYRSQFLINGNVPELPETILGTVYEEYQVFRDYGMGWDWGLGTVTCTGTWYYQLPSYEFEYGIFEGSDPVSITLESYQTFKKGDIDKNGVIEINDVIIIMQELIKN